MAKRLNPEAFNGWVYEHIDDYSHRLEVYYGGAGSGKSYGAFQKVILKALNLRRKVLVIRKVGATLRDSVYQLALDQLAECGLLRSSRVNRSDFRIELPNGSLFLFKGLDDREKIKSITGITDIVIEEATELTEEDFTQLSLRLRPPDPDPQIYLMFNPVSKANWVYRYFFEQPPADAFILHTNYKDNRFLPPEYCATLEDMQHRNPAYYRIYALGGVCDAGPAGISVRRAPDRFGGRGAGCQAVGGVGFWLRQRPIGAGVGVLVEAAHTIYITGEYVKTGMLNDEIAARIIELGLSKEVITADCAEQKSIAEIKRAGVYRIRPSRKGPDSVVHGIQWINQQRIVIDERCTHTLEETENYTWKKERKTGEYINEPEDAYNHCLDAVRYGLQGVAGMDKLRTINKALLGL